MLGEKHDLIHEFPEHGERIHALKVENTHFAKLFNEYDALVHEISLLEEQGSPVADETLEEKKKIRLKLKDEMYAMIVAG